MSSIRRHLLEEAHFNVLHVDAADVPLDLLTDVPPRSFVEAVAEAGLSDSGDLPREPRLLAATEAVYGPARYVAVTKGRAAERALAAAVIRPGNIVLTNALFRTTQQALLGVGAKLEPIARSMEAARSDPDLDALTARLARGGVRAVYLEVANNAVGGWPLTLGCLQAAREACRRADALLLLDATRLHGNCLAQPGSLRANVQAYTATVDGFTVSCAKESPIPLGALVGVRDERAHRDAFGYAFEQGTLLEPIEERIRLNAALLHVAQAGEQSLRDRARHLDHLATSLRARDVPIVEPIGAHAVFVDVGIEPGQLTPARARSLECWLYELAGVRALVAPNAALGRSLLRLPVQIGRFRDAALDEAAEGVAQALSRRAEAPSLQARPGSGLNPFLDHYELVQAGGGP